MWVCSDGEGTRDGNVTILYRHYASFAPLVTAAIPGYAGGRVDIPLAPLSRREIPR